MVLSVAKKIFHKLDRRNTGYGDWAYYINRQPNINIGLFNATQKFYEWRNWCWQTWGPSKELVSWFEDLRNQIQNPNLIAISHNEHWCWQHDQYATRIYLRTDKELSMFLLKWSI